DERRSELGRVGGTAVAPTQSTAHRIETFVAISEVVRVPVDRVRRREPFERVGDRVRRVANRLVAADQIGVRVDEHHTVVAQPPRCVQIEEYGAAPDEWFDVSIERTWIEPAKMRQQLTFAAGPFNRG